MDGGRGLVSALMGEAVRVHIEGFIKNGKQLKLNEFLLIS